MLLIQAKLRGQSPFIRHSGLQLGGRPMKSGKQLHDANWFTTAHCEFGPQGDGKHGFAFGFGCGGAGAETKVIIITNLL